MANRRAKPPNSRAAAAPAAKDGGAAKARGARASKPANAPGAEAKPDNVSSRKPKWVNALATSVPTPEPVKQPARRAGADALDDWVHAPAAEPAPTGQAAPSASGDTPPAVTPVFAAKAGRASGKGAPAKPARAAAKGAKAPSEEPPKVPAIEAARLETAPEPAPKRAARARKEGSPRTSAEPAPEARAPEEAERPASAAQPVDVTKTEPAPEARAPEGAERPASAAQPIDVAKPGPAPEARAPEEAERPATEPASAAQPIGVVKPEPAAVALAASAPQPPATVAAPAPPAKAPAPAGALRSSGQNDPFGFGFRYPMPDFEALARNIASAMEHAGKVFAAYMRPRETGEIKTKIADEVGEMIRSLGHLAEYYMADPKRAIDAQAAFATQFINLWAATLQRFQGQTAKAIAEPDRSDKRFADAEWRDNPFFDFVKQAYVLTNDWAEDLLKRADEMDPHARDKARFYLKQVSAAFSPSNFVGTNPELLRATLAESGENLVRGLKMLAEDIEAGRGNLRIRQVDASAFQLGVNMAMTPGKVIFRNDLIELIQYAPTTPEVYKRPLLIFPPWINKFYILDLNPQKSFVRWAVEQGLTVFVVSWVNPDARHADKDFDSYMNEGIMAALDAVEQATGERKVSAIGYCVGGTLLAATLGYMAQVGDDRIDSVTFLTTQIDFTDAGDLKIFVDAEQLKQTEERMANQGYLEGTSMAQAFNMLRPNDLIWSYYVNNYLKGKEPMPFDLLVWNADATRMPAANHMFYLRHCYLQNDLSNGRMVLGGKTIDLKKVTIPVYELAAKEDHIAPARSAFNGAKCLGGPVRYVMAGSGHIAGVVNPPSKPKYQYWTNGPVEGSFEDWVKAAKETPGSWWPDWVQWLTAQAPEKVPARTPGDGQLTPLCDAPGEYVLVKS